MRPLIRIYAQDLLSNKNFQHISKEMLEGVIKRMKLDKDDASGWGTDEEMGLLAKLFKINICCLDVCIMFA